MTYTKRTGMAAFSWLICLIVCLLLIGGGILIQTRIIEVGLNDFWLRVICGVLLIIGGGLLGYFSSLKLVHMVAIWMPKGDFKGQAKQGSKGPKLVVVGGGTGLGTILRGLKEITPNLTAIVTVADDGGSSGRLRQEFGILPPGDIRNCLVAMANLEPLMEKLMQYRFNGGSGLAGHNFGNLFLAALTGITGNFEEAIKESSKVLAVRGQVLPATLEDVVLKAKLSDGSVISGESTISKSKLPIEQVFLEPANSKPVAEAITALKEADVIILGPGSLYTSVIPNLLVDGVADAIRESAAVKVYICNAMTQPGETDDYTASDHVRAVLNHAGQDLIDVAIINTEPIPNEILERYTEEGAQPVTPDFDNFKSLSVTPLGAKIIVKSNVIRHDAAKLATMIVRLSRTRQFAFTLGKSFTRRLYRLLKRLPGLVVSKLQ